MSSSRAISVYGSAAAGGATARRPALAFPIVRRPRSSLGAIGGIPGARVESLHIHIHIHIHRRAYLGPGWRVRPRVRLKSGFRFRSGSRVGLQ